MLESIGLDKSYGIELSKKDSKLLEYNFISEVNELLIACEGVFLMQMRSSKKMKT